ARPLDRFADSSDEQVRQYARIEAAGAKHDEVGVQDGRQGWTVGVRLVRLEEDALDGRIVVRDRRLTADARAVDEIGAEGDVLQGRWQDAATDVEDLRGLDNALLEAPGDLRHRGDEEVAEGVAGELGSLLVEPIVEQASHQRLIVRQGHEAVPDIARRRDVEDIPDTAGATTVIRDRDDRGEVDVVELEAAEEGAQPSTAADSDDIELRLVGAESMLIDDLGEGASRGVGCQERRDKGAAQLPQRDTEEKGTSGDEEHAAPRLRYGLECEPL